MYSTSDTGIAREVRRIETEWDAWRFSNNSQCRWAKCEEEMTTNLEGQLTDLSLYKMCKARLLWMYDSYSLHHHFCACGGLGFISSRGINIPQPPRRPYCIGHNNDGNDDSKSKHIIINTRPGKLHLFLKYCLHLLHHRPLLLLA